MGKSKAKKAVTTNTNQKSITSFFKPSANAHSPPRKMNALEDVTNIKRLKDVKSLKPLKVKSQLNSKFSKKLSAATTVPPPPIEADAIGDQITYAKKEFNVFKDVDAVETVDSNVQDTIAAVDQVDPVAMLPPVNVADFRYANQLIQVTPGEVNLVDLPAGMYLHGAIEGDGACLFRSVSFALCESQYLYKLYRQQALEYISAHHTDFEADILQMSNRTVDQYVTYMSPDVIFGDQIMVIALCLYLDVSLTLFQRGLETIDAYTFAPVHGHPTKHVNIYLDLYAAHYDCIISSPLAPEQAAFSVKTFFSKKQTTATDMLSDSYEENANNSFGRSAIQTLKNNPEHSATSLKRKAAAIEVSDDDEDVSTAIDPAEPTAISLPVEIRIPKTCTRHGCKEGNKKRSGEIVSFHDGKNECDQCRNGRKKSVKRSTENAAENHRFIKEEAAEISDPILKKEKLMESSTFAGNQKAAETHRRIKEEATQISDLILKKKKLMESSWFAGIQKRKEARRTDPVAFNLGITSSMVSSSASRGQTLSQDDARDIWLPLIAANKQCTQCGVNVMESSLSESGPLKASPQRSDPTNPSYVNNCVVFCMYCQNFNNDTPDTEIEALLSSTLPQSDSFIRLPTDWTPTLPIPGVSHPIPDTDAVDPAFIKWLDVHLGTPTSKGKWRGHETLPNRRNHRPVTVTRKQVIELWRQNGGNWDRFFGVRGSWVPGDPMLLSIDKIDPAKGYEHGNLMIISVRANNGKWHFGFKHYPDLLRRRQVMAPFDKSLKFPAKSLAKC